MVFIRLAVLYPNNSWMLFPIRRWEAKPRGAAQVKSGAGEAAPGHLFSHPGQVTATSWYISKLNATLICLIPPKLMMNEFSVVRKYLAKPHGFLWTAPGVLCAQGT